MLVLTMSQSLGTTFMIANQAAARMNSSFFNFMADVSLFVEFNGFNRFQKGNFI